MDILVVKKKQGKFKMKVTKKKNRGYEDTNYLNSIDVRDFKQFASFLEDMKILFDAPVDKAIKEMKKKKMFWD